jgi:hypothetical protein
MISRWRTFTLPVAALALSVTGAALVTSGPLAPLVPGVRAVAASLPTRLSDQEFWQLVTESSEPEGFFRSDNLLSNELGFQNVVTELVRATKRGRVYMGVGPEQNFTYIAATRPAMVFIVDVRRGNLELQLMYKALFELSADRAEFVSRLFSRPRPDKLTSKSSAAEIFSAFSRVPRSDALHTENLAAIQSRLMKTHGLDLSKENLDGIAYVFSAFFRYGPGIRYSSTSSFGGSYQPNYADLMTATDESGLARSYLASEDHFKFMKDLESRNMVVPVIGNFGGPKAIRAVGKYLKARNATVSAFYLSNVEQYLRQDGLWYSFCANVATLPLDDSSTFIRSVRRPGDATPGFGLASELASMASAVQTCRP